MPEQPITQIDRYDHVECDTWDEVHHTGNDMCCCDMWKDMDVKEKEMNFEKKKKWN